MLKEFAPKRLQNDNYVIDTSVLINHPESIHSMDGENLYIPMEVLEELDSLKIRSDRVGVAARYVNRFLDKMRDNGSLFNGIKLDNDQMLFVALSEDLSTLPGGLKNTNDNKIISVAYKMMNDGKEPILLSNDIALRIKCDALGIKAKEYIFDKTAEKVFNEYTGISIIETSKEVIDNLFANNFVELEGSNFSPNEGILLKSESSSGLAIAETPTTARKLRYAGSRNFAVQGIRPRSKEQAIAMELLLDPEIHMATLIGRAGCGKTLLAIATAVENLQNGVYEKIVISRPVQTTSKEIGFLPGTKEEKMAPWLQPIFDNLNVIFSKKSSGYFELMMKKGVIEVEALGYIRGRTLPNTIFIIDEAQNITHHEAKAVLTRMGENSKIILIGDLEQIDSPKVNELTSGLYSVVRRFRGFKRSGHVKLVKGERSELATFAAEVM